MSRAWRWSIAPLALAAGMASAQEDPYLWLEEVAGEKAMEWVHRQNEAARPLLESEPSFKATHERLLAILTSRERIPSVTRRGGWLYNFWQDATHPRGVLRRTTLEEYRKAEPKWEVVLDVTRLAAEENEKWVYKGSTCLEPEERRCMVALSRGGADAVELREFDLVDKAFVKDGFRLPESKGAVDWRDQGTLYAARDFGPGTLTRSGYARTVREARRGAPPAEWPVVYEAREDDVGAWPDVIREDGRSYELIRRVISTRYAEVFIRRGERWVRLETPRDADVAPFNGRLLVRLRTDWKPGERTFRAGSLVSTDLDRFVAGGRDFDVVFEPGPRVSLQAFIATKSRLVLDVLDNVKGRVIEARREDGRWVRREVPVPPMSSIGLAAFDRQSSDDYWMTVTGFTQPTTLYLVAGGEAERMKSLPAFFDAAGITVTQHEATSRDGTKVPYFAVLPKGAKLDGSTPTILYGYGGFEIAQTPSYIASAGSAWLEKGGAWVLANIRGGGEFGPEWHLTARREGRQKTHDDFVAVAEDLIARKISSPAKLGIYGGSQGGLLVGATFTQRPELFAAAVATVPLFDMKRYHKLLAGASWIGEYGDPDKPEDWAFISKYSPYQNLARDRKYPKVFITTTTRDDRVHPGHARKMVARLRELEHDVVYFENVEGGHGSGSTPAQQAYTLALIYTFFRQQLF